MAPFASPTDWLQLVNQPQTEAEAALRCCVNRGRPCGDPNWVTDTAKQLGLECTVRPRGRPKKQSWACHSYLCYLDSPDLVAVTFRGCWRKGDRVPKTAVVIGNRRSRVYHKPACRGAATMSEKDRVKFDTAAQAEAAGYRRAGDCR